MRLSDHERARDTVTLSADQFNKLVELLTPGYELAKMYVEQQQKQAEMRAADDAEQEGQKPGISDGVDAAIKDEIDSPPADIATSGDQTT